MDRFASVQTRQLERYCSQYRNPACESVHAFTVSWSKENNWLFPLPFLIPCVLKHMSAGGEDGTLLVPHWPSASWLFWPCNDCWSVDVMVRGPIVIYLYAGVMTIYWLCCFGLSVCCCHGSLPQAVLAKGVFHSTDILLLC